MAWTHNRISDTRRRPVAIIVGAAPRVVVTIARSLHRAGVRCLVAVPPNESLSAASRAVSSVVQLDGSVADAAAMLRLLADAERAVWIAPTCDDALAIVGHSYAALTQICPVASPQPHIAVRALDRSQTLAAAERCGIPIPLSAVIESACELETMIERISFPVIVQPLENAARQSHGFKARVFGTAGELRHAFEVDAASGERLLFQHYAPGGAVGVALLMHNGEPIAKFQHRRLSELPPSGGVAVVAISEPTDPVLLDHAVRLLRELEWEGIAMVEFRHDSATGAVTLTKVNGRFWGSIALPVAAGMDFPLYAWQIGQGVQPSVPSSYREGLRVRWTAGALKRLVHATERQRAYAAPDEDEMTSVSAQFFRAFCPGARSALWSWLDPLPAVQESVEVLKLAVKHAAKIVIHSTLPLSVLGAVKAARELPRGRRLRYLQRQLTRSAGWERPHQLPGAIGSVLFVCHGNIMRSAAAAQLLRDMLAASGPEGIRVASAGTATLAGRRADTRVQEAAHTLGTSLAAHRSRRLTAALVNDADIIFAMDDLNVVNIAAAFPTSRHKIMLLGGMTPSGTWAPAEIADPYHATASDVQATVTRIHGYVAALHQVLRSRAAVDRISHR